MRRTWPTVQAVGSAQGGATDERQLALLVASVRDYAIFMLDPNGYIRTWNTGARHLKGYEAGEIIGRHFSTFYTDVDRERDHPAHELEIAVREGRYEEEGWRVRKDGTTFWASVTITAVRDLDGELTGFAKVTRDLTERKRSEDALQDAIEELRLANAELDRFSSIAAHDMADPLRTISGFAEVLAEQQVSPEESREYAQHILDSSLRLSGMLDGLLTYARAGRPGSSRESVELATVAEQAVADLAGPIDMRAAQVTLDLPTGAAVIAEPHDVRLVLQNLVSNAVKFADPATPAVKVGAEPADGYWRVSVEDNGPGIPSDDRPRIFDAFQRATTEHGPVGYGLGLAICKRLVERHGGRLDLESGMEQGTRFSFILPADGGPG
jgi:PAS domain S-box-containing protein